MIIRFIAQALYLVIVIGLFGALAISIFISIEEWLNKDKNEGRRRQMAKRAERLKEMGLEEY